MSTNTNQTIYGDEDDDHLVGGARADYIDGGNGDDSIIAGGGNDILIGGAGNDFLNGGGAADTYIFNLTLRNTGELIEELFRNGNTPNQNADWEAWSNYLDQLQAWRIDLVNQYGPDTDESVISDALYKIARDTYGDVPDFDNSYLTQGNNFVLDAEGDDIIAQLVVAQGDKIRFNVTQDVLLQNITTEIIDINNDGKLDTVLNFSGEGQIAILNSQWNSVNQMLDLGLFEFVI